MTEERFREILIEEGLTDKELISGIWEGRPYDDIREDLLRETCQWMVGQPMYGRFCRK